MTHKMDIDTFKTNFDGGTRPNRFVVNLTMGPYGTGGPAFEFHCKAASMPAETVGILQVPFRGRVAKLPGDRAYPEWNITMIDETTFGIRDHFERWHSDFNFHKENIVGSPSVLSGTGAHFGTATVQQLDMMGNVIRCTRLMRTWPVEVGAIDLSFDVADTLTEYSITLAYDYLEKC